MSAFLLYFFGWLLDSGFSGFWGLAFLTGGAAFWWCCWFFVFCLSRFGLFAKVFCGEFDPGSGRTLAACLTHASRTERPQACLGCSSGERVSNT